MPIPSYALPHLARVVQTVRTGPKNAQGERQPSEDDGPWFPARRMSPRPTEDAADSGGRRRTEVRWNLLYGDEYDDGTPLTRPPRESDLVDVKRDETITRYVVGPRPQQLDTGEDIIGGQCDLLEVADGS